MTLTALQQSEAYNYIKQSPQREEDSITKYDPRLLINNPSKNESVLSSVVEGLTHCLSFMFIVAFVTESGLSTLKSHFYDLKLKGIRGKLLTSTYLSFNHPKVFRELLKIENMEVRLTDLQGFHSKGYIFNNEVNYGLIIGSSNLTANALKVNYEWNLKLTLQSNVELMKQIMQQFDEVWDSALPLSDIWIKKYELTYVKYTAQKIVEQLATEALNNAPTQATLPAVEPNKMQQAAIKRIEEVRQQGQQRALIISATGTGKTFLSAFDVRSYNPARVLFIAHREQILLKAKTEYIKIMGGQDQEYGILSGSVKNSGAKYLFATIQTISKTEMLNSFDPTAFDYILIDEVHKAGAASYNKVIDFFKPKFLLGMTATPERSDDFNIYQLFHYNIAYEIRLQAALEEDMLCPFHYFGVSDLEYNGEVIDDTTLLSKLVTDERVDHLINKVEYYGYSGDRVKGLIFCSRKEEAEKLSEMMNQRGYKTKALTGDHSIEFREQQVQSLESGELEYLVTVDIFNEGIDIPCVNQVVMLRQTQSSIIFIQQLGRGLRKHDSKEFVTIIDFIGNYKNNYLIPIALSGDQSLNKDNIRKNMKETSYIKGISTINFEEVARERIYKSITNSNLTELKKLKDAFKELKNRIGRLPYLTDFIKHNSVDPVVLVKLYSSYHHFLLKINEEVPVLDAYEQKVLAMLSTELIPGKRLHEIVLLEMLLSQERVNYKQYLGELRELGCPTDERVMRSVQRVMELSFFAQVQREKYGNRPLCELNKNGQYEWNEEIKRSISSKEYFRSLLQDLVQSAYNKADEFKVEAPLTLHKKYSRKEVCKLLQWDKDESSTIYGYKTKHGTCPIFVTYHKHEDVESSVNYGDELLSPSVLKWFTRSNRTLQSDEVNTIIKSQEHGTDIHIFVKKDDDEGSDFYYLGKATSDPQSIQQTQMNGKNEQEVPVVTMNMILEQAVEYSLYQYLKNN